MKLIWNDLVYTEVVHLLLWTSVSTVRLSERCLNLDDFTCSLMAISYVLCRELVLEFCGLEPETNLKMNQYTLKLCTSYCGRPSRPSVGLRGV